MLKQGGYDVKQIIKNDWWDILQPAFHSNSYQQLRYFLVHQYKSYEINPHPTQIFNAFRFTPFHDVKVVILGQDPYPNPKDAMGLSFSVMPSRPVPASLQNIYKEFASDLHIEQPRNNGCLVPWTKQGVLLLNTVLTCKAGQSGSHEKHGWEQFTDYAIKKLSQRKEPVIFVLWGKKAQAKENIINTNTNVIIKSSHPSPFSARYGFFGSRPFSKINYALHKFNEKSIQWKLPNKYTIQDLTNDVKGK